MQETKVSPKSFIFLHTDICLNICAKKCVLGVRCEKSKIEGLVRQENVREVFSKARGARFVNDKKLESAYFACCVCKP